MVGFLNYYGGTIYLGIKEDYNKLRKVVGMTLNETEKEELMFNIRQMSGKIQPDILLVKMYKVKFVPVKNPKGFIRGRYVVKIIVEMGRPNEVYHYHLNDQVGSRVCFRTENEVLVRDSKNELSKIIEFFKKRMERPLEPKKEHDGDCPEPEIGQSYI
jgi:predicted HTH transcriptional regulator